MQTIYLKRMSFAKYLTEPSGSSYLGAANVNLLWSYLFQVTRPHSIGTTVIQSIFSFNLYDAVSSRKSPVGRCGHISRSILIRCRTYLDLGLNGFL